MAGNAPLGDWEEALHVEYSGLNDETVYRTALAVVGGHLADVAKQAAASKLHFIEARVLAAQSTIERFTGKKREAYETACKAVRMAQASDNQSVLFAVCHPFLLGCAGETMGQYEDTESVIAAAGAALHPPYATCIQRILQAEAMQGEGGVALYEQAILEAQVAQFQNPKDAHRLHARALVGLGRALCGLPDAERRRWAQEVEDTARGLACLEKAVELLCLLCSSEEVALHEPCLQSDITLANKARLYLGQALLRSAMLTQAKEQLLKLCEDMNDMYLLSEELMDEEDVLGFHLVPSSSNYVCRSAVCTLLQVLLALGTEADKEQALWVAETGRARAFRTRWYKKREPCWLRGWTLGRDPDPFGHVLDVVQLDSATLVYYACLDVIGSVVAVWVVDQYGNLLDCKTIDVARDNSLGFSDWADLITNTRGMVQEHEDMRDGSMSLDGHDQEEDLPRGLFAGSPGPKRLEKALWRLEDLYDMLIRPIEGCLADQLDVVVVPDGALHLLPFRALRRRETKEYLFQRHAVRVNPSLAVWRCCIEARPTEGQIAKSATAIAVKDFSHCGVLHNGKVLGPLLKAEEEGQKLQDEALYGAAGCRVFRGAEATVEAVVAAMEEEEAVLHFALHGLVDRQALVLHDGLLTAKRISGMRLKAHLVVLSACDSGQGAYGADGVYSIARAFAMAGVPCVVMTLWPICDALTAGLMHKFHTCFRATRKADEALRRATADAVTDPAVLHKFNWAAVTIMGTCASLPEEMPGIKEAMARAEVACKARGWPPPTAASCKQARADAKASGVPAPTIAEFFLAVAQGTEKPLAAYMQACQDAASRGDPSPPSWKQFLGFLPERDASKYRVRLLKPQAEEREFHWNRIGRYVAAPDAGETQPAPPALSRQEIYEAYGRRYQFAEQGA